MIYIKKYIYIYIIWEMRNFTRILSINAHSIYVKLDMCFFRKGIY